jgi:threonine/homoserine efflux transporter RhtA
MDDADATKPCSVGVQMTDTEEQPVLRTIPSRHATVFALVVVAPLLDLATFFPAIARVGIGAESNPLARALYQWDGPLGLAALKVAAIAILLLVLVRVTRRFPAYALPAALLVVAFELAGMASNVFFGLLR